MYKRALAGYEKALGPDHTSTLNTVNNLGTLYADQGKLDEAKQMYLRSLVSFRRILRDEISPSKATIHGFATALCRSIRIDSVNDSIARSELLELSNHIKKWRQGNTAIVNWLAKALIGVKDDQNAQLAFRYSIRYPNDNNADFGGTLCDGCLYYITISTGRYVCRQCSDIDLCEICMSKHERNTLALARCRDHCFFSVDTTSLEINQPPTGKFEVDFDVWIENVGNQYS